jgi:hypothetical protein
MSLNITTATKTTLQAFNSGPVYEVYISNNHTAESVVSLYGAPVFEDGTEGAASTYLYVIKNLKIPTATSVVIDVDHVNGNTQNLVIQTHSSTVNLTVTKIITR